MISKFSHCNIFNTYDKWDSERELIVLLDSAFIVSKLYNCVKQHNLAKISHIYILKAVLNECQCQI